MTDLPDTSDRGQYRDGTDNSLVISYVVLRRAVGFLGTTFPLVLYFGNLLLGDVWGVEKSISAYYATSMRDVFVGELFAVALFMFAYRGYDVRDEIAGKAACLFAIGVALFPEPSQVLWVARAHLVFAAALFVTFAYFSLCLFTKTGASPRPPPRVARKQMRNRVYAACGVAMLVFIGLIALYYLLGQPAGVAAFKPVFVLETLSLWAFGVSWWVKGETILRDEY
jgi:hypothetical protein